MTEFAFKYKIGTTVQYRYQSKHRLGIINKVVFSMDRDGKISPKYTMVEALGEIFIREENILESFTKDEYEQT